MHYHYYPNLDLLLRETTYGTQFELRWGECLTTVYFVIYAYYFKCFKQKCKYIYKILFFYTSVTSINILKGTFPFVFF